MSVEERRIRLVRAPNPGPMTLDGTNTWIIGDPAQGAPLVLDPGPALDDHLDAVLAAAGGRVGGIVLTHRHLDHSEGAPALAGRARCGVRAADPGLRKGGLEGLGADGLDDGDVIEAVGVRLVVLETPGHTSDSRCLLLHRPGAPSALFTGDTVLGRGTSVITHPDGDLAAYLDSLQLLAQVVAEHGVEQIFPGHGPVVEDPRAWLDHYRRHRHERLDQVRAALAAGAVTPADVVDRVYPEVGRDLRPAAEQSVRAQLDYLRAGS